MGRRERIDNHVASILGLDARKLRELDAAPRLSWRSAATVTALVVGLAAPGPEGPARRRAENAYTVLMTADLGWRTLAAGPQPAIGPGSAAAQTGDALEATRAGPSAGADPGVSRDLLGPVPHASSRELRVRLRDDRRAAAPSFRGGRRRADRGSEDVYALLERRHTRDASGALDASQAGAAPRLVELSSALPLKDLAALQRRSEQRTRLEAIDAIRFLRQK